MIPQEHAVDLDGIDWAAIPGHPGFYRPEHAEEGLRLLTSATTDADVRAATAMLTGGGLIHGHSAAVLPSAAVAAPILAAVAEHGIPLARATAVSLLDDALTLLPHAGFGRTAQGVPLCCAIADSARHHTTALARNGHRDLLTEIDRHWRVVVTASAPHDPILLGNLTGAPPPQPAQAEIVHDGAPARVVTVAVDIPPPHRGGEALLRVPASATAIPTRALLVPAACGNAVH
ncbi:hypothetical protein [Saccharomonospora xinjiangensis]|uniref:hypothetical protein n=1 Tax=Saccharomonospora xinjiangensis TaxID=75294 RepID=UPI0002F53F0B|nr:hypothetical protein [Saccharomonospora xinjiangensis]